MNKEIFRSVDANEKNLTVNEAGGKAYSRDDEAALAQFAMTTFFEDQYYTTANTQFNQFKDLLGKVDPLFAGKLAVYAHEQGKMKDTPVVILASLMNPKTMHIFDLVFPRVITNGKQLCNFVNVVRSNTVTVNRSFGSHAKKTIQSWINSRDLYQLFKDSIGNDPSLADVIKMTHPKAKDEIRNNFYAYILSKENDLEKLPKFIQDFENFKNGKTTEVPSIDFRFLTSMTLSTEQWKQIGRKMPWHALRMNLNTLHRHGCFADNGFVDEVAKKLVDDFDPEKIKVFPYQIMAAYKFGSDELPAKITNALQDVIEKSVVNVEKFNEEVLLMVDVSGSMQSNMSSRSKMNCSDVAGLIAGVVLRQNDTAEVMPFDTVVRDLKINPKDSIITNATKLAFNGGGTSCSAPLKVANNKNIDAKLLIMVSDNESWFDTNNRGKTEMQSQWTIYNKRVPGSKLVCIDLATNATTQTVDSHNVMNIGGFSDEIFKVINDFANNSQKNAAVCWTDEINKISLDATKKV